ncbi:MAG: anti-sigma factor family protein [Candidatus Nanopelagicaceae bacterium]
MSYDVAPMTCRSVMASIHPFIDNQIEDSALFNAIAFHLQGCADCAMRTERERKQITILRNLLTRSCIEITPENVEEQIVLQIRSLAARMQAPGFLGIGTTQIYSQYQRTEITIDGETTIEIEESHEIRRDFPL